MVLHLWHLQKCRFWINISILETRTTMYKVRNARCASSRYTMKLSLIFLITESMNEWINQQSISRTAHPPLKMPVWPMRSREVWWFTNERRSNETLKSELMHKNYFWEKHCAVNSLVCKFIISNIRNLFQPTLLIIP